jgi:hypothetical protein
MKTLYTLTQLYGKLLSNCRLKVIDCFEHDIVYEIDRGKIIFVFKYRGYFNNVYHSILQCLVNENWIAVEHFLEEKPVLFL